MSSTSMNDPMVSTEGFLWISVINPNDLMDWSDESMMDLSIIGRTISPHTALKPPGRPARPGFFEAKDGFRARCFEPNLRAAGGVANSNRHSRRIMQGTSGK